LDETQGDPIKKSALIKEIVSTISLIPDGITRTLYVRECSSMMQVPEQVLVNEINKILRNRIAKQVTESGRPEEAGIEEPVPVAPQQVAYDPDSDESQEREIIRLLLTFGSDDLVFKQKDDKGEEQEIRIRVADFILRDILRDELVFDDEILGRIFQEFAQGLEEEKMPDRMAFLTHPDPDIQRTAIDLDLTGHELSPNWEKNNIFVPTEEQKKQGIITTALYAFKSKKIEKMLREIQHKMASVTTPEEASTLQKEYIELKKTSNYIHSQLLGRTIIR
jgi:DNA primase